VRSIYWRKNAYQPFVEILELLAKPTASEGGKNKFISIIKTTSPEWLAAIPSIGPKLKVSYNTANLAMDNRLASQSYSSNDKTKAMALQFVNAIVKISTNYSPLVLVIEDSQWIDDRSCQLILRIRHFIVDKKILLIMTYRPDLVDDSPLITCKSELFKDAAARGTEKARGTNVSESSLPIESNPRPSENIPPTIDKKEIEQETDSEDIDPEALMILKMRFAKGEISKEEFEEMKNSLR
jgi:hypothetical protein